MILKKVGVIKLVDINVKLNFYFFEKYVVRDFLAKNCKINVILLVKFGFLFFCKKICGSKGRELE